MSDPTITYSSYLRVPELLDLQTPKSVPREHDEMLFIVIHQVYELWFKQILHEVEYLQKHFAKDDKPHILHTFKRILTILKVLVTQIDVLETMTPLEFNSFRAFLASSSGFQSAQFRELEFLLGHKRLSMVNHFPEDSPERQKLEERYDAPTIWDSFLYFLSLNGYAMPIHALERDVTQAIEPDEQIQDIIVKAYRNDSAVRSVCERLVDLDEGLQEWRYRHVKMVERTIGTKPGTGGSAGVKYLQTTLHPLFPDLWAIRVRL